MQGSTNPTALRSLGDGVSLGRQDQLLQTSVVERKSKIILFFSFRIFAIIFVITTPVIIAIINAEVEVGGQAGHVQGGPAEGVGMDGEAGPDVEQCGGD